MLTIVPDDSVNGEMGRSTSTFLRYSELYEVNATVKSDETMAFSISILDVLIKGYSQNFNPVSTPLDMKNGS